MGKEIIKKPPLFPVYPRTAGFFPGAAFFPTVFPLFFAGNLYRPVPSDRKSVV